MAIQNNTLDDQRCLICYDSEATLYAFVKRSVNYNQKDKLLELFKLACGKPHTVCLNCMDPWWKEEFAIKGKHQCVYCKSDYYGLYPVKLFDTIIQKPLMDLTEADIEHLTLENKIYLIEELIKGKNQDPDNLEQAIRVVNLIPSNSYDYAYEKSILFEKIAEAYIDNNIEKALEMASLIEIANHKLTLFGKIVAVYKNANNLEKALEEVIQSLQKRDNKSILFIAKIYLKAIL